MQINIVLSVFIGLLVAIRGNLADTPENVGKITE
jgi:hypothetical protein